ncbi:pyridoxal phosphate-dependent aminotransferase [Coxiella endosymbiont of Amblyomma sculptum]|uniref:pyridoxal phosphate-dependent aminotransferase n=1 Tax=Coxiella endosymbiont of Amblyomma sculptum TaxID=2487929 RepID=UPI00132F1A96|nr:pyridoxal phosphate-dependent aminotransferase [Coxiella endosymbiont of Amblyomma sculptum]QHG92636.1 pyridoxal phosphate-dependent aminotransferase [Coxiella endosymbiont of Amblyomma sculptum]
MNDILLSSRARKIEPSATIIVSNLAIELISQGCDVIDLSTGEPDFDTPNFIKKSAIKAIQSGFTKYTCVGGTFSLKAAIAQKLRRDNQLYYESDEIIVSNGAKQSIYNAMMAVLDIGDEVIVPAPYWVSYPSIIKITEATPVIVQTTLLQNFKILPQQLEEAITSKTRLLILNSPNNPSGAIYSKLELEHLSAILLKHPKILIISDEIYEYIFWGQDRFSNIVNICPELRDRTIIINGVSKAYAMTGWRIGYAAGSKVIVQAMKNIQSQSTSCPNAIAQVAATTALNYDRSHFDYMYKTYKVRHDLVLGAFSRMQGIKCLPASGTFYLFPNVTEIIKRLKFSSDIEFSSYLLNKVNIAVVPGSAFGFPGHVRLSCAASSAKLKETIHRLSTVLRL